MAEDGANEDEGMFKGKRRKEGQQPQQAEAPQSEQERFLRLAAEFDNYKKRTAKELSDAKTVGKAELLREMLPVLDEFEVALPAAAKSPDMHVAKGIELLYSNFREAMKKAGLQEIPTEGRFDPHRHDIVMVRDDTDKPDGTILEVTRKGYTFNGIMLRPAMVIVAKKKTESEEAEEKTDDTKK